MKFYIIAGEASGDLHGSNLVKEIKKLSPQSEFRGMGGDLMKAQGASLIYHIAQTSFMGFAEVAKNIFTIVKIFRTAKKDILNFSPDAVILIDYPGFNLRMAEFCHRNGRKVFYYISPQLWAWKKSRVKIIRDFVDKIFVILPFEKKFYADNGVEAEFVGHPLLDIIPSRVIGEKDLSTEGMTNNGGKLVVALLPGSREQEIKRILPKMLSVVSEFPDCRFVVAGAPAMDKNFYSSFTKDANVRVIFNHTHEILSYADFALVTSGTATLETALFNVPQAVCYEGGKISYAIGRRLVKVPFVSLVNLIAEREVVKEFIQTALTKENLSSELRRIISDKSYREKILGGYKELREKLGSAGASERTAKKILELMK